MYLMSWFYFRELRVVMLDVDRGRGVEEEEEEEEE